MPETSTDKSTNKSEEKLVVVQADELREGIAEEIVCWDEPFTFFYDETNNIRKLRVTEIGTNIPELKNFVLAGIVLRPGQQFPNMGELRASLKLPNTVNELKFRHIAEGDYESVLNSKRIEKVLAWMLKHDILVHYSNLNVLFWSLIDIVDSLWLHRQFKQYMLYHNELKGELYHVVLHDVSAFMQLLNSYSYPNLDPKKNEAFLTEVLAFWNRHVKADRSAGAKLLKAMLKDASKLDRLEFLHDNEDKVLIENFSFYFMRNIYTFKHASHTFDKETYIERAMKNTVIKDGDRIIDYRFVDSKADPRVQLSDLFCGLIGRHFNYVQEYTLGELQSRKSKLNQRQLGNLAMLKKIIDQSDAVSNGFFQATIPLESHWRNNFFLHGVNHDQEFAK